MKKEYLNRIKANISIYSKNSTSSFLDGSYKSIYKGKSLNFDDLREYVIGDDIRNIDWKASARSRNLLVKQYIAERTHNILLVVDVDSKMSAHSKHNEEKNDISLMTSGTIAYLGYKNGDAIGTIYDDNGNMKVYPFKRDLYNIESLLAHLDHALLNQTTSDLNKSLNYIKNNIKRSVILFIITDLAGMDSIDEKYFKELSMRHDIMLISISDASIYGDTVYDLDSKEYIPKIISKNSDLFILEEQIKNEVYVSCINKISKYRVATVTINDISEIPMKIMRLLEDYKYVNRN